jgi:hypothetical protein
MRADTTKGTDYDARLRELCTTKYGMTPVEADIAEVMHAACWCQSTHDAYAEDGGLYEGCGPWTEREVVRGLMSAARPVHYREAAVSLRAIATAWRFEMHTDHPVTAEFCTGISYAAERLESVAKDLEEGEPE